MQIDFSTVDEAQDFVSIPAGTYVCRVAEVREGFTRDGSPRWAMRLEVAEGDYAGRTAAWDGLVWSERGLPRAKQVLARLGIDVSGTVDLVPDLILGRCVRAQLEIEEREDPVRGATVTRLRVPYLGYESAREDERACGGNGTSPF